MTDGKFHISVTAYSPKSFLFATEKYLIGFQHAISKTEEGYCRNLILSIRLMWFLCCSIPPAIIQAWGYNTLRILPQARELWKSWYENSIPDGRYDITSIFVSNYHIALIYEKKTSMQLCQCTWCSNVISSNFPTFSPHISTWWRLRIETYSALLAICAGNSSFTGEYPTQRPVTRSFAVFFDLRLNKLLSKQSWGWWFETLSSPLWRHSNDISVMAAKSVIRKVTVNISTHIIILIYTHFDWQSTPWNVIWLWYNEH